MTVHALVSQCAEPRERCFEVFRMQNSQNFPGLRPWTPPGRVYSAPPQKNCWIRTAPENTRKFVNLGKYYPLCND